MSSKKSFLRQLFPRILKAVVKATIVLVVFLVVSQFLAPLEQFLPQIKSLVETYVIVYMVFIIAGELTKGTIFQYGLNMGKAFFFIGYSIYALNNGIITQTIESVTFSVNLQIFLIMIIIIGILDFAKSLLQMINYMANKAETEETIIVPAIVEQEIPAQ
jgi:hypothetical protein